MAFNFQNALENIRKLPFWHITNSNIEMIDFGLGKNRGFNFKIGVTYVVLAPNAKNVHHAL
jgi:hypothetical protein